MYKTLTHKPYGFSFHTKSRKDDELDSNITKRSNTYFINGVVKTLQEIEDENDIKNETLLWNMKTNKFNKVIYVHGCVYEFEDNDINLTLEDD